MVTLQDIADITGLSISTVSRVLNNKGKISDDTKRKVLGAAEELMFKKGVVSKTLDQYRYNVGIIIPQSGEYYHDDPNSSVDIRTIRGCFEQRGHATALYIYTQEKKAEENILKRLRSDGIQAVLVSDPLVEGKLIDLLIRENIPYVIFNGVYRDREYNYIDFDNYKAMKELTQLVLSKGHKKLLILAGPHTHLVNQNRLEGLFSALDEHNIKLADEDLLFGSFSLESGYQRAKEYMFQKEYTAIIGFNDYIAMGAMKAVRESGRKIPQDIAVVGFDDVEFAQYTEPPLTTVHRLSDYIGALIVSTLTELCMHNKDIEYTQVLFNAPVVERTSL